MYTYMERGYIRHGTKGEEEKKSRLAADRWVGGQVEQGEQGGRRYILLRGKRR
jgi:hypothetical protein